MRLTSAHLLIGWLILTPFAFGPGEVSARPSTAPASEVAALITKLGDSDFRARRDATNRLRQIGAAALPKLHEAMNDNDPEVRARAAAIVRVLEHRPIPGRPRNHGPSSSVSLSIENGERSVEVDDEGRRIQIRQGADGIEMTVTGEVDGRPATETYKARDADSLKADNPDAFALYQRWVSGLGADEDGNGIPNNLILRGNVAIIPPMPQPLIRTGGDDLGALRDRIDDQMHKANLPPQQQQRVHDALDRVDQARQFNGPGQAGNPDENIRRYDRACDDLRKVLGDLKLPDPGDALPPPQGARLGISVAPDLGNGGLIVSHVMPRSRADQIGLKEDDVIRKVNNQDLHGIKDLRRLVTNHPRGLVLDITRDGREMKLEEK